MQALVGQELEVEDNSIPRPGGARGRQGVSLSRGNNNNIGWHAPPIQTRTRTRPGGGPPPRAPSPWRCAQRSTRMRAPAAAPGSSAAAGWRAARTARSLPGAHPSSAGGPLGWPWATGAAASPGTGPPARRWRVPVARWRPGPNNKGGRCVGAVLAARTRPPQCQRPVRIR